MKSHLKLFFHCYVELQYIGIPITSKKGPNYIIIHMILCRNDDV